MTLLRSLPLLAAVVLAGCGGPPPPQTAPQPAPSAEARARADSVRRPYTEADVRFMTDMMAHHGQALVMAGWAPSHGAGRSVRILAERIVNAQQDEIATMQQWLRDRGLTVPDATSTRHKMKMNGMEHEMLMPGMMTDEQMAALDKARGPEFDRLFLEGMIRHHQGAVDMVDTLFKAYGAAQDELIYRFASDVYADQSTEIARMQKMLEEKPK